MREIVKVAVLVMTLACISGNSTAQDKLREIEKPAKYAYPNQPVEVVRTEVADKPFLNGQIRADSDWLQNLKITIRNISGKDINWIALDLILREEGEGRSRLVIPVYFGRGRSGSDQTLLFAGQETEMKARKDDVDYWLKYCKNQGIEDIDKIIVDIRSIQFTDNTGWYVGIPTRKDSQSDKYSQ